MKLIDHIHHALNAPPDSGDAAAFAGSTTLLAIINPWHWLSTLIFGVLVSYLSRLLWEFTKPLIGGFIGRTKVKDFTDVSIDQDEHDIYNDSPPTKPNR